MRFKPNLATVLLLFSAFLGYLTASYLGAVGGALTYYIISLLLNLSLIPFVGYFVWKYCANHLIENLNRFLDLNLVAEKVFWFYDFQAIIYTVLSSIAVILVAYLAIKYFPHRKKIVDLKSLLPQLNLEKLTPEYVNNIKKQVGDKKLLGSILFFFGQGIAQHDFYWETSEETVYVTRLHGVQEGLALATLGINIIETSLVKIWYYYLGLGLSTLGFYLLSVFPRGTRLIPKVLWYLGSALMFLNWYLLVKGMEENVITSLKQLEM